MKALRLETPEAFAFLYDPPLGSVRYRVGYGGRGSGKSWQFARALLVHALARPLRVLCAREYQASIRDSVHRVLADQIEALGLGAFYTVRETEIVGANGSLFIFKGIRRDITQIKSTEGVDVVWIEEAEAVSDLSWRVLIPTVRKPGSEIWATFNPGQATDPTYVRFVLQPPPDAIVRRVNYLENPYCPDVLIREAEHLRAVDPDAFAHVWQGEPWARSDAIVLAGKVVVREFDDAGLGEPLYGADWGFAHDPTILVRCFVHDGRLYVSHEAGGVGLDHDATARAFDTVPGARAYMIRADSARPETIAEMKKRGFRIEAAAKWSGSVEDGVAHLRSYTDIIVHPRARRTAEEARLWRYKVDPRTSEILPALVDANNHAWDAVRYALVRLIKKGPAAFVL